MEWNDEWRTELKENDYGCYERLCECRNNINDVVVMANLMHKYNPTTDKEDCLNRMIEWVGDWNDQFDLMDKMCTDFQKYLANVY